MRNFVGRLTITCAVLLAAASTVLSSPAQAAVAANPFTPAQACNRDFGGSWAHANDGHRAIKDDRGRVVADVYLMYDHSTAKNCVTTLKRVLIGSETFVNARLVVQDSDTKVQNGAYKYYAAVQLSARDRCVKYSGVIDIDSGVGGVFDAGRDTWGNCG